MFYIFLLAVFFLSCYLMTWAQVAATKRTQSIFSLGNVLFGLAVTFLFFYFRIGI
jgi:hypothetical protein